MDENSSDNAEREIRLSLKLSNFCIRLVGIDFYEEESLYGYLAMKLRLYASSFAVIWLLLGELAFIINTILISSRIEDVVGLIHLWGYAVISVAKFATLWWKKPAFMKLLTGLVEIWPKPARTLRPEEQAIKDQSLNSLRMVHFWYFWVTVTGLWLYILSPALIHAYLTLAGHDSELGSPWRVLYPFDRRAPVLRELTYAWEVFMGLCVVCPVLAADLLYAALASHVGMLLRILNLRLRTFAPAAAPALTPHDGHTPHDDHYGDVVEMIKLHQTLIRYCLDIEDAFSLVLLINVMLSSINICCAGFICVLVEPLMSLTTKVFLVASLIQIGVLCWYGDDIYQVNAEAGEAAYAGAWYRCDARARHALRFLIHRSQKPLTFTAMKFNYMNLTTFTSILTNSYSYFALLRTMYTEKVSEQ